MSNGWTQLNTAVGAYQARKTREAVEEQNRMLRGDLADQVRADLNRQWHEILAERDRVWKETCDRMWRMGWDQGFNSGAEWQREQDRDVPSAE